MYRRRIQQIRRTAHELRTHEAAARRQAHLEHERTQLMTRMHLR